MPCTCNPETNYFGTYQTCVKRMLPFATERYPVLYTKPVDIDKCIVKEVEHLWSIGIQTVESCCGHNRVQPYVSVERKDERRMLALGYKKIKSLHFEIELN